MYHVSRVTCHMSCVTCHFFLSQKETGKCDGAGWWRVCYQQGLPHLVLGFMKESYVSGTTYLMTV